MLFGGLQAHGVAGDDEGHLAVLELPFRTQSAFSDILATVALVENPTARQRIAQKRVAEMQTELTELKR